MSEEAKVREDLVHGAAFDCACLDDLTTAGTLPTKHTNQVDWWGLHAQGTQNPIGVPGLQVDGYFLDASKTTTAPGNYYGNPKYSCDSQFVMRFPRDWNEKLVVTGSPGVRGQYANDFIIGDFALEQGYAFASTDKGNSGPRFYSADNVPGAAVAEWHRRIKQLTEAAKEAAEKHYGIKPRRTYVTGTSNGGYLTRYALENHPELYDGGVDCQGPLWVDPDEYGSDPDGGPNLLTFLPRALRYFPEYDDLRSRAARDAIILAGFEPASEFLWDYYYGSYWSITQRIYREELDPFYIGAEADYNFAERLKPPKQANPQLQPLVEQQAQEIKKAVKDVSLTGDIGKPLITLHGTLDALLPIRKTSDRYAQLVDDAGRTDLHRYYRIEGGTHVDSLYDDHPGELRPLLPCYRSSFKALVRWAEEGIEPPPSQVVRKREGGDVVNCCPRLKERQGG
jgi:pimeloyl-ACP methyl ester carboxylesterase